MRRRARTGIPPVLVGVGAALLAVGCSSGAPAAQTPVASAPPASVAVTRAAAPGGHTTRSSVPRSASPAPRSSPGHVVPSPSPWTPPRATVTVTVSAHPATPPSTPAGEPTTIGTSPGILTGSWGGHGRELVVRSDGSVTVIYRTYRTCGDDSPPCDTVKGNTIYDGGRITMRITRVVTAHHTTTAAATVLTSTEPDFPVGSTQSLLLDGDIIDLGRGFTFCDDKAPAGACGA